MLYWRPDITGQVELVLGLRLLQVHTAFIQRCRAGGRAGILHEQDGASGLRAQVVIGMRVRVEHDVTGAERLITVLPPPRLHTRPGRSHGGE